jgi:hypothetical protein
MAIYIKSSLHIGIYDCWKISVGERWLMEQFSSINIYAGVNKEWMWTWAEYHTA